MSFVFILGVNIIYLNNKPNHFITFLFVSGILGKFCQHNFRIIVLIHENNGWYENGINVDITTLINTMNRKETEDETKATKNTKNVWKWILGVGIVLMLIAFWGGFFNQKKSFSEAETPSATVADSTESASDTTMEVHPDTIMKSVRGTE